LIFTACWIVPEVATTEMVLETGLELECPPPHAERSVRAEVVKAKSRSWRKSRRRRQRKVASTKANIGVANDGPPGPGCWSERGRLAVEDAEMVSVVDIAAPAEGVTEAGEKLQVTPAGRPVQLKVVAPVNPY
jgi:hypothetical protein